MKSWLIIISLLLLIFVSSYLMYNYILNTSSDVTNELVKLDSKVRNSQWDEAFGGASDIENKWNHMKDKWALLLDHQEIDNINISLSKMKEYIKGKNRNDSLAEVSTLKLLFIHIPEKEAISLKNIL